MSSKSAIERRYIRHGCARLYQGDLLKKVEFPIVSYEGEEAVIESIALPYAVVLTQDCDLEHDARNRNDATEGHDKFLRFLLIAPAYLSESFKAGTHLEAMKLKMKSQAGDIWRSIKQQGHKRYHFLPQDPELSVPDLVVDFKHFYTVNRDLLGAEPSKYYLASVNELFREELSQRFAYYLSRVALPEFPPNVTSSAVPA